LKGLGGAARRAEFLDYTADRAWTIGFVFRKGPRTALGFELRRRERLCLSLVANLAPTACLSFLPAASNHLETLIMEIDSPDL